MPVLRGGGERIRTADFYVANVALYQLSYTPEGSHSRCSPEVVSVGRTPRLARAWRRAWTSVVVRSPRVRSSTAAEGVGGAAQAAGDGVGVVDGDEQRRRRRPSPPSSASPLARSPARSRSSRWRRSSLAASARPLQPGRHARRRARSAPGSGLAARRGRRSARPRRTPSRRRGGSRRGATPGTGASAVLGLAQGAAGLVGQRRAASGSRRWTARMSRPQARMVRRQAARPPPGPVGRAPGRARTRLTTASSSRRRSKRRRPVGLSWRSGAGADRRRSRPRGAVGPGGSAPSCSALGRHAAQAHQQGDVGRRSSGVEPRRWATSTTPSDEQAQRRPRRRRRSRRAQDVAPAALVRRASGRRRPTA